MRVSYFCSSLWRPCRDEQRYIRVKIDEIRYCAFPVERDWVSHTERKPIYLSSICVSQQASIYAWTKSLSLKEEIMEAEKLGEEKRNKTEHLFLPISMRKIRTRRMKEWLDTLLVLWELYLQMAPLTFCTKAWSASVQTVTRAYTPHRNICHSPRQCQWR